MAKLDGLDFPPAPPAPSPAELRSAVTRLRLENADLTTRLSIALGQLADHRLALCATEVESRQTAQQREFAARRESDRCSARLAHLQSQVTAQEREIAAASLASKTVLSLASGYFGATFLSPAALIAYFEKHADGGLAATVERKYQKTRAAAVGLHDRELRKCQREIVKLREQIAMLQCRQRPRIHRTTLIAMEERICELERSNRTLGEINERLQLEAATATAETAAARDGELRRARGKIAELSSELHNLKAETQIEWFDAIPNDVSSKTQKAIREVLQNTDLSVAERVKCAIQRALASRPEKPDAARALASFVPDLCQLVLGQPCDVETFALNPALHREVLDKLRDFQETRNANARLALELQQRTNKLSFLRRNLRQINHQLEVGTAEVTGDRGTDPGSAADERPRPKVDAALGEYDHLLKDLETKGERKKRRKRSDE
jgi:hypothetical protein